ncbi:MAG TPA: mechanosensitive ion channel family protein [Niabella sp.]|nr:mechanosensitive ion channel family protein [Niabella sp.]HOZ97699.1 mechanosensitive ion channel family protein [Niabella sp.]HQW14005.1 mechanosensitive ion channel family protein [Niabella sp.]HQX19452.1 mechanosensitive ion channel family protein [Niabella sp.]HQX40195.1 mechanosensitive ion channel family protein [Niabella sp.]
MNLLQIENATSQTSNFLFRAKEMAIDFAPKLLGALLVYIIGAWIIKKLAGILDKVFVKRNYDPSLRTFLSSLVKVSLTILLLLSVFQMLGVQITAFAALLAGAGLAIGAALNGSLGNFAGGAMMLIFKPFKVGDMIEAQGQTGIVQEQGIFNTMILTADNKTVILPNGPLSTGTIVNYTTHGNLRVDIAMSVSPDMNLDNVRQVTIAAMKQHPKVLDNPIPEVSVLIVGDGMVTLAVRPYTAQPDYWDVYFGVQELVKNAWDANGIQGPTPHHVVINK